MTLFDEPRDWGPTYTECKLCKTWRPQAEMLEDACINCGSRIMVGA